MGRGKGSGASVSFLKAFSIYPAVMSWQLFAQAAQFIQCLPWHLKAVAFGPAHFDDVPFGRGSGLAQPEYFFIKVTFKGSVLAFLDVNRLRAPGELFEHRDGI